MDYKVIIADEGVSEETILTVFQTLQTLVIERKNINLAEASPFMVEGQSAVLVGTVWGVSRSYTEDIEELSSTFPDLTFNVIQVNSLLNGKHFEELTHYSMSVYQDGQLQEVFKPEPIVWKSAKKVEIMPDPWA